MVSSARCGVRGEVRSAQCEVRSALPGCTGAPALRAAHFALFLDVE